MGILDDRMEELKAKELLKCYGPDCKKCGRFAYCPMFAGGKS